jgi:hypothetical protein
MGLMLAAGTDEPCNENESVSFLVSPWSVSAGETFGVLAASEEALKDAAIEVSGPDGALQPLRAAAPPTGGPHGSRRDPRVPTRRPW